MTTRCLFTKHETDCIPIHNKFKIYWLTLTRCYEMIAVSWKRSTKYFGFIWHDCFFAIRKIVITEFTSVWLWKWTLFPADTILHLSHEKIIVLSISNRISNDFSIYLSVLEHPYHRPFCNWTCVTRTKARSIFYTLINIISLKKGKFKFVIYLNIFQR